MDFTPGSENRKILNQEFNQEKYKEFRDWYFANHNSDQLAEFKTQYYQHLELHQKLIPFVEWYKSVGTAMTGCLFLMNSTPMDNFAPLLPTKSILNPFPLV